MSRQKAKGTKYETAFVEYERMAFGDDERTIRRATLSGANDEGDVVGLTFHGERIVVECKDHRKYELREWMREAKRESENADTSLWVVSFHLNGVGIANMGEQAILTTTDNFNHLLGATWPRED